MAQSQTNLCNKRPFPSEIVVYEHVQWSAATNALMIVVSLSDSPCSARQRGKGVSELHCAIVMPLHVGLENSLLVKYKKACSIT